MQESDRLVQREHFFLKVYEEYKKPLGTFLFRLLARKDETEDLYQDVLIKFWFHLQRHQNFPTPEETKKWLYTVAHHQVIDKYRRGGRLLSEPADTIANTLYDPTPMEDRLSEQDHLEWALRQMSPMYRICLVLQDLYGYSQKEIANILNITPKTVSTNVLRGRKQLLAALDDTHRKKEEEKTHAK
jgi:RNA polymerase sigma-70 factor (ECF subfamily)